MTDCRYVSTNPTKVRDGRDEPFTTPSCSRHSHVPAVGAYLVLAPLKDIARPAPVDRLASD